MITNGAGEIDWTEKCGVWTVHSEVGKRPTLRGFAKTRADAEKLMQELKSKDSDATHSEYWVLELSKGELEDFRAFQMLPPGY